ncbi:hypothetical protein MHFGQ_21980 [Moorella humiferrea]|uniref:Uncharacterized protein n=1 Tax=Neomoorella humiferrea TaxID=676965 RepID=A0A2T0AM38_9FIRM|nr:hypothetical protein MOHU_22290 [Moorella humiferrea]
MIGARCKTRPLFVGLYIVYLTQEYCPKIDFGKRFIIITQAFCEIKQRKILFEKRKSMSKILNRGGGSGCE